MNPAADIPILFADLGTPATIIVAGAAVGDVTILWQEPGVVVSPYSGLEATAPGALIESRHIAELAITHGAQVIKDDTAWYIVGLEPDGTGLTRLTLSLNPDN